ncbi:hypothetical protein DAPPUDRAFT_302597 [Daphnia pulex]|uniref:Uncharacterized protein n=1 Tax=Daphnia pulex TaxID=6669 RepID=E9GDL4_DAPPU|nr:hypothetical protein DAPPUDRAFT_302597 [Daphnia pulex]|eukprot:EFX82460.1 hypothetical protein DAPPUDRAFT_302597 [Daphnia pulex]
MKASEDLRHGNNCSAHLSPNAFLIVKPIRNYRTPMTRVALLPSRYNCRKAQAERWNRSPRKNCINRGKAIGVSRVNVSNTATTASYYLSLAALFISSYNEFVILYGGCQTATLPSYYTTYATTSYFTTKAPEYYTTIYDARSCTTKVPEYYTTTLFSTKAGEYYTEVSKFYSAPSFTITSEEAKYYYPTAAPSYYIDLKDYTDAIANYTKTYATPRYCTTEVEYYTTTNAAPVYYTDEPQYYSSLSYYRTETSVYYTTWVPEFYTSAYASPSYYAEAPKYVSKAPEYYHC